MEKFNQTEGKHERLSTRELSKVDMSVLLERVELFNGSFGDVATFIKYQSEKENRSEDDFSNNDYEKYKMEDKITSGVENILRDTDLELEVEKGSSSDIDGGNELEYNELVFCLKDGKQFVKYLESLDPKTMTASQLDGIKNITYEIVNRIYYSDVTDPLDDNFYEIIGNGQKILSECKRIGIVEFERKGWGGTFNPVLKLENLLYHSKEGSLKEFLLAHNLELSAHIFSPPNEFKPVWENVFKTLLEIRENTKAMKVYEKALSEAKKSINRAITEFKNAKRLDDKTREKLIVTAQSIKLRLEDF